ncbi:DUF2202 domain-containing protein [Thiolapillus sp.]
MKKTVIAIALPLAAMLAVSPLQAGWKGGKPGAGGGQGNTGSQTITAELSDAEATTLLFMREEEKLARDVYNTLFDQWEHPVFNNISGSEQRHMDSMKNMIDKYGLVDPVVDDTVGVFQNEGLAEVYERLIERGSASLEEALHVGGFIEELDISDLEDAIDESTHADVTRAYENLERGSRNHLRAFVGQIENLGIVYEAQLMPQEEVDEIVNSAMERGGKGRGKRRGGR